MKNKLFPILLLTVLLFSCEAEFSPNAEWREVPVVYCVLDQDDDTSWVRVEKCYLSEGNIYAYGSVSDSINYQPGVINVYLLAYRGGVCVDSIPFTYTVRDRQSGDFAFEAQPIYYSTATLHESDMYKLVVRRKSDGSIICSTDSIPLIIQDNSVLVTEPANNSMFIFKGSGGNAHCNIKWNVLRNARRYQPIVRFYYLENGDTNYLDLHCNSRTLDNPNAQALSVEYSRAAFLGTIKEALKNKPADRIYLKKVDIYVTACSEDLNAYMVSLAVNGGIEQVGEVYSNIDGGVGVFATRRTHLFKNVRADSSLVPNVGLYWYIKQLGVGF